MVVVNTCPIVITRLVIYVEIPLTFALITMIIRLAR